MNNGPPYANVSPVPSLTATFDLLDGHQMPIMGLGVFQVRPGEECLNTVSGALEEGYRMIDSAQAYGNEKDVGEALRASGIPRKEVFVVTKLSDNNHGYEKALAAGRHSNSLLNIGYIDLLLVHSPNTGKLIETWDALLQLQKEGVVRSIGVSNYNVAHIEALRSHDRPLPAVNQIEMHPLVYKGRQALLEYCKSQGIVVQAYGSMFWGQQDKLADKTVADVVAAHPGKSSAQVLLRWGLQMGFQLIPKSVRRHRIKENADIFDFELSELEMAKLSGLKGREDTRSALGYWSPLEAPVDLGRTGFKTKDPQDDL